MKHKDDCEVEYVINNFSKKIRGYMIGFLVYGDTIPMLALRTGTSDLLVNVENIVTVRLFNPPKLQAIKPNVSVEVQ